MTATTAHPGAHFSARAVALAFLGCLLAAGAGYGVATLVLDEATAPSVNELESFGFEPNRNVEPGLFPGTDREERALMHRHT